MVALALLRSPLGLEDPSLFGAWVGASVHDVGQVLAASSVAGSAAVQAAVVVKLSRVVLLAPLVAGLGLAQRRKQRTADGSVADAGRSGRRRPLVPLFVVGFLVAMTARSATELPPALLDAASGVQVVLLSAAMVGLGTGVRIDRLRRVGAAPLVLGAGAWLLVASVAYLGVTLTR